MRFPANLCSESPDQLAENAARALPHVESYLRNEGVDPTAYTASLEAGFVPLAGWLAGSRGTGRSVVVGAELTTARAEPGSGLRAPGSGPRARVHPLLRKRPPVIGVSGAQGSGKSTFAAVLQIILERSYELRCARLSLDDLYLTRAERRERARTIHPLFETRGVPGTHDVELGREIFAALSRTEPSRVALPRFDKALDDRADPARWPEVETPLDCIVFEGWCLGARAVPERELAAPINALERERDPDGSFRRYANAMLAGPYRALFDAVDVLVFLAVPDLECSRAWRLEQERKLRARVGPSAPTLSDAALAQFVEFYERISRQMLADLPSRADVVLSLDPAHAFSGLHLQPL